jgi:hypothetical protein
MDSLDNILITKDFNAYNHFIIINDQIKIFQHLYLKLLTKQIDENTYINFCKILFENSFDFSRIASVKKLICLQESNNLILSYKYTLLSFINCDLKIRLKGLLNIIETNKSPLIYNVYKTKTDLSNFFDNIKIFLQAFDIKFKTLNKSNTDIPSKNITSKYSNVYLEDIWVQENTTEIINRLIFLVQYFDIKIFRFIELEIITIDDALNLEYIKLVKYYDKIIYNLIAYFNKTHKIIEIQNDIKILIDQIISHNSDVNIDKYKFIVINPSKKNIRFVLKQDISNNLMIDISNNSMIDISNNTINDISNNTIIDTSDNTMFDISNNTMIYISNSTIIDASDNTIIDASDNTIIDISNNTMINISNHTIIDISNNTIIDISNNTIIDISNNTNI